jgi:hypothetical protein
MVLSRQAGRALAFAGERPIRLSSVYLVITVLALTLAGCGRVAVIDDASVPTIYAPVASPGQTGEAYERLAPFYLLYDLDEAHNRIGAPSARSQEEVYVDPDAPALYYEVRHFTTGRASYVNYIYRIHFTETPFSLVPFTVTAGEHPGILVIVTVDAGGNPVLVSQAGTCGCYVVVVPTDYLSADMLPDCWSGEPLKVFGETLAPLVAYKGVSRPRLLVEIRPDNHRVVSLRVEAEPLAAGRAAGLAGEAATVALPLFEEARLHKLAYPGGVTSFFYTKGMGRAHVRGAGRPWELALMSWWAFDLYVGEDKDYGDHDNPQRDSSYNPFYTSLKFWARAGSDMADFPRFLKYWGWKL